MASSADSSSLDVAYNLREVLSRLNQTWEDADSGKRAAKGTPRLVAVSKTKPKELVIDAYEAGQRDFGENYIQELYDKSHDADVLRRCPDIRWHLIGTCQSNKAAKVVKAEKIASVETVTSLKLADVLQRACAKEEKSIEVMVQVNTSGEASKGGVAPSAVVDLATHITSKCPNLHLSGLMTIGALGHSLATEHEQGANPDFMLLLQCRKDVAAALNVKETELELSMGMSGDFEEAIRMGSTSVRVGSSIFGARDYAKKKEEEKEKEKVAGKLADLSLKEDDDSKK